MTYFIVRLVTVAALATTAMIAAVVAGASPASADVPASVVIRYDQTNLCIAIDNADAGHPAILATCSSPYVDRVFRPIPAPKGKNDETYSLALANGTCLQPATSARRTQAAIGAVCDGSDLQVWVLHPYNEGFVIRNYVTSGDAMPQAGQPAQYVPLWAGSDDGDGHWHLDSVPAPVPQRLFNQATNSFCAAVNYGTAGQQALLADCDNTADRNYWLQPVEDGHTDAAGHPDHFRLKLANQVCLSVAGASLTASAFVIGSACSNADSSQVWAVPLSRIGDITNAHSGLCLDTAGRGTNKFTPLVQHTCPTSTNPVPTAIWTLVSSS